MVERDHALRRLLAEARSYKSGEAPPFNHLWSAARTQVEQRQPATVRWADAFSAVVATACVLLIGLFLALDMRKEHAGVTSDSMLYDQLIARTAWQSPTDVLLDSATLPLLGTLPELPAVNTHPSLEILL